MTRNHKFAVLIASAALTGSVAVPALGALRDPDAREAPTASAIADDPAGPWQFASGGEDDDDDDEEGCDDEDDGCSRQEPTSGPARPVAPPQNGLFGTGAPPQVKVN